ncbi:SIMPL domain-containing protein [Thiomicrorhabdus arctica]|uniref:SIMPL domain-containing protein n=1 Tax=Thiomicrorhabdus arctica TaxID=131540 RepID=UPI00036F0BD1|nr:SIMPL domain-containing protein [Thiomicrorhabdus arctica]
MFNRLLHTMRRNSKRLLLVLTLSITSLLSPSAIAQAATNHNNEIQSNQVHFSISESQNIPNDQLTIIFNHVAQGNSAQIVADEINVKMQDALIVLNQYPDVNHQTSQYHIRPAYNKQQIITHWTGSQNLTITLENKPELIKVLTDLQPYLTYQSMQFGVSTQLKTDITQKLTMKAIQTFQKQSAMIAQGFHAPDYRILETRINTPYNPPIMHSYAPNRMLTTEGMAPPAVSSGESTLRVDISGVLQLSP